MQMTKQRFYRARKSARNILVQSQHKVNYLDDPVFHIEAIREKELRKIRIVFDEIKEEDIESVRNYELPQICTKEIWLRKSGEKKFIVKTLNP
ncbi:hypothetical protein ES703_103821 [subsurface metagenome]